MFPNEEEKPKAPQMQDERAFDGQCSDSSSEDSADEDQPDHSALEAAESAVLGKWDGAVDTDKLPGIAIYSRHPLSRTIHMQQDEAGLKFACGRDITKIYLALPSRPQTLLPICKQCFSRFRKNQL